MRKTIKIDRENDAEMVAILRANFPQCEIVEWFIPTTIFNHTQDASVITSPGKRAVFVRIHPDGFVETLCNHSAI